MDINELLKRKECGCGKIHECDIEHIYVEKNAISNHLSELCEKYGKILLVADENTYLAAGEKAECALGKKKIRKIIFDGSTVLIPDEKAIESIRAKLDGIDLILAVGSGVIQDLCKYVSHFATLPYMVVATAPSMDGYASSVAAMILGGMKETVSTRLPKAIIADTEVLRNAPIDMIKSGYGDIIGKFSALCDWRLSNAVNGEGLCKYIYDITYATVQKTLDTAKGLLDRDENSIKALTEALMIVGIMMSFATNSRPASGSEHHLSHFFEITGIIDSTPYFPHGIDVAYSTVITAQIREKLLKSSFVKKQYCPERTEYEKIMSEIYKEVAAGCIALQDKSGNYNKERVCIYKSKEAEIRSILADMPSSEEIKQMLSLVGLDFSELYNLYGEKKVEQAILYAKDLKDRYTVLWMNFDLLGE